MSADEFEEYMSGKIQPSNSWESALIMCEVSVSSLKVDPHFCFVLLFTGLLNLFFINNNNPLLINYIIILAPVFSLKFKSNQPNMDVNTIEIYLNRVILLCSSKSKLCYNVGNC